MNLLNDHPEFREATFSFADRMRKLLNIDVKSVCISMVCSAQTKLVLFLRSAGQLPGPADMLTVAQDPELRELSMKCVRVLSTG